MARSASDPVSFLARNAVTPIPMSMSHWARVMRYVSPPRSVAPALLRIISGTKIRAAPNPRATNVAITRNIFRDIIKKI